MKLRALKGTVIVDDITRGERMFGSILLLNDNGRLEGIRPRWCRVYAVGSDITTVKPGEWILVKHGNWTRSMEVVMEEGQPAVPFWAINWPEGGLLVSEEPDGDTFSNKPSVEPLSKRTE